MKDLLFSSAIVIAALAFIKPLPAQGDGANAAADYTHEILDALDSNANRLGRFCRKYCDTIQDADELSEAVQNGLSVLNGEAVVIDQKLIDAINADAERLRNLGASPPEFTALTDERVEILNGDDFDKIQEEYRKFEEERNKYISKYERWIEKRDMASMIADDAIAADRRRMELERVIGDLIVSAPEAALVAFFRFDLLWGDIQVPLANATENRAGAAVELRNKYDDAVRVMRENIRRTTPLQETIEILKHEKILGWGNDLSFLDEPIQGSEELADAVDTVAKLKATELPSDQAIAIKELLDGMLISNKEIRRQAEKIISEAIKKDEEAARANIKQAIISMGLSVAGAVGQSSPGQVQATQDPAGNYNPFYYREDIWGFEIAPDGTRTLYHRSRQGADSGFKLKLPDPG